jgi:hypothetical protein
MVIVLALIAAAPQGAGRRIDLVAEGNCIIEDLDARIKAGKPFDPDAATMVCKTRYGWTDEETKLAVQLGQMISIAADDRAHAVKSGVSEQLLDAFFAELSAEDVIKLGIPSQDTSVTDQNQVRARVGEIVSKRIRPGRSAVDDPNLQAQLAVISRAQVRNAVRAFEAVRKSR